MRKVRAKNDAFFARTKKFEIDFDAPICQNNQIFILMSIVNNIFWSKYDTKMIFGAMNRIWPTFYRWNCVKKMGAEMGALVLNRKLSASMKKWVKISTSKRFLDHAHIENGPTMVRESRPHFRPLFRNTFRWISTQYQSPTYENVLFFQFCLTDPHFTEFQKPTAPISAPIFFTMKKFRISTTTFHFIMYA